MDENDILKFGEHRLWKLANQDISLAIEAIKNRVADGIIISKHFGYVHQDIECLTRFAELQVLAIDDLNGVSISAIQKLKQLRFLSVGDVDQGLDLSGLIELRELRLQETKRRKLPVRGLPKLVRLALWNYSGADLNILNNYPELSSMEIFKASKLQSIAGIRYCQKLVSVVFSYCPSLVDITEIGQLKMLENLDLQNAKKISDWSPIKALTLLNRLIIDKCSDLPSVDFMSSLSKLNHLVIMSTPILSCNLTPIQNLVELSYLYIDNKKEYTPAVSELRQLIDARQARK